MKLRRDDAEIFYTDAGRGPSVVLLHPFPSCHEFWLPVAEKLSHRYHVVLPDLRGMGQSGVGSSVVTMNSHAQDIAAICREIGVEKAVFIGCSIGGYILFECWRVMREQFRGMVLCNTKASADSEEARANRVKSISDVHNQGPSPFCDKMAKICMGESTQRNRPDIFTAARNTMRMSSVKGLVANLECLGARMDSIPTLKTIQVPTLILAGNEDVLTNPDGAKAMQNGIAKSQLKTVHQTGHYTPFENPEETAHLLRQFLDGITH
jgi:3-oxoadipate enol-lactonase